jgi:hypothetical protein
MRIVSTAATGRGDNDDDTKTPLNMNHNNQYNDISQKAAEVGDESLDSTRDRLGLELLDGDARRIGWGLLIRAPLNHKVHY